MISNKNIVLNALTHGEIRLVSGGSNVFKKVGKLAGDLNQKIDKAAEKIGKKLEQLDPVQEAKNAAESIKNAAKDFKDGWAESRNSTATTPPKDL